MGKDTHSPEERAAARHEKIDALHETLASAVEALALAALSVVMLWPAIADHAMYHTGLELFSALLGRVSEVVCDLRFRHASGSWWTRLGDMI